MAQTLLSTPLAHASRNASLGVRFGVNAIDQRVLVRVKLDVTEPKSRVLLTLGLSQLSCRDWTACSGEPYAVIGGHLEITIGLPRAKDVPGYLHHHHRHRGRLQNTANGVKAVVFAHDAISAPQAAQPFPKHLSALKSDAHARLHIEARKWLDAQQRG